MALHMLAPDVLEKAIQEAERKIPVDKTAALIGAVDEKGISVALVVRKAVGSAVFEGGFIFRHDWEEVAPGTKDTFGVQFLGAI